MSPAPRSRGWFVRALSWPVSLVLIIATVAVGDQILKHTPSTQEAKRPFIHSGQIGDTVDARTFTARVDSVRGARSVADSNGKVYTSDGLFLLVRVTVTATTDTTSLEKPALVGGGISYWSSDRVRQRMGDYSFEPAIPVRGEIVFEVPANPPAGLAVQLSTDQILADEYAYGTVAQIDLAIDQAHLTQWRAEAGPLELTVPELK